MKASAEMGNYDSRTYKARINLPLVDDMLALKLGVVDRERKGFYDNVTLGGTTGAVDFGAQTASLRWAPDERVDAILTYDRIIDRSDTLPQDPRFNGDDPFENLADKKEPSKYDVDQWGLRVDWEISDNVTVHNVTGFHDGHDIVNQDFDGGSIAGVAIPFAQLHTLRDQEYEVFTEEVRLDWTINEQWDVMLGLYYFKSELNFTQRTNNVLQLPGVALGLPAGVPCAAAGLRANPSVGDAICQIPNARSVQIAGEDVKSKAAFGSLTWRPTAALEFMVGARWIDEKKDAFNSYFDYTDGAFDTRGPAFEFDFTGRPERVGTAYSGGDSWDDVIMTASANWAFTDNNRVYANYSEGFRSGGFSIRSARPNASEAAFDPEDGWQFEVGVKNEFFDRRLRLNVAWFTLERDGSQFSSIIPLPPGSIPGTTTLINNGGKQEIDGWEVESTWLFAPDWAFSFSGGVIDVKNEQISFACEFIDGCATATPGVTDPAGTPRVLGGDDNSRQPEWNIALSLGYEKDIGPGTFSANVGWKKVGKFLLVQTGGAANQQLFDGNYVQVDARVAYEWRMENGSAFTLSAFGKNLNDSEWREQALFLGGFNTGFQGWGAPRTYAVELMYTH
ncbi:MAG: TonB-dependent receptor [Pseudomonadales bacterium]|nr:TonB-dependent receptor [Pseudomonadales bacterium]